MFGIFKKKNNISNPLEEVEAHLKIMGYNLLPYGAAVALADIKNGYNSVEAASLIAVTTMALDIKEAGDDILSLMAFLPHGLALLKVLKKYKENNQMHPTQWQNDSAAVWHIVNVDEKQLEWVDKILSDPVAGKERLAVSRIDYTKNLPVDEEDEEGEL